MGEQPEKMYWMGRDIEEMGRDELIAVVRELAKSQKAARKQFQDYLDLETSFRAARAAPPAT
jgi:hypothetical protein